MKIIAPIAIGEGSAVTATPGVARSLWDKNGVLQSVTDGSLRITYDPADLSAAPYPLIEPVAATNLWTNSADVSGLPVNGAVTSVLNSAMAPDGTTSADVVTVAAAGQGFYRFFDLHAGDTYTASVFVESLSGDSRLRWGSDTNGTWYATYDLSTGVASAGSPSVTARMDKVGSTRWRLKITLALPADHFALTLYSLGACSFIPWGFQLVAGTDAGSYIPTAGAPVTRPADVLGPNFGLIYCSLTENDTDDAPLFNPASAYAVGERVRRTETHRVYECLVAQSAGAAVTPETNLTGTTPKWMDVEPTNRWAAFDNTIGTPASAPASITYVIRPGKVATALAGLGMSASEMRVSVVGADGALHYCSTKNLRIKNCRGLKDYFFRPVVYKTDEVFDDLPPYVKGLICVTVYKPNSTAVVGDLVVGRAEEIGELQWKPEVRTTRFSKITTDNFGRTTFVKRRSAKLFSGDVFVELDQADEVVRLLDEYTDDPVVCIGDSTYSSLIALGFMQDFRLTLDDPGGAYYNFQFQGLT